MLSKRGVGTAGVVVAALCGVCAMQLVNIGRPQVSKARLSAEGSGGADRGHCFCEQGVIVGRAAPFRHRSILPVLIGAVGSADGGEVCGDQDAQRVAAVGIHTARVLIWRAQRHPAPAGVEFEAQGDIFCSHARVAALGICPRCEHR